MENYLAESGKHYSAETRHSTRFVTKIQNTNRRKSIRWKVENTIPRKWNILLDSLQKSKILIGGKLFGGKWKTLFRGNETFYEIFHKNLKLTEILIGGKWKVLFRGHPNQWNLLPFKSNSTAHYTLRMQWNCKKKMWTKLDEIRWISHGSGMSPTRHSSPNYFYNTAPLYQQS